MLYRLLVVCADLSPGLWRLVLGHVRSRFRGLCAERVAAHRRHEELVVRERFRVSPNVNDPVRHC